MDYKHQNAIESCIRKVHEQQGTLEKVQEMNDELEKTYDKAKTFDKILEMYKISNEHENIESMSMWQSPYEQYIEKLVKEYLEDK